MRVVKTQGRGGKQTQQMLRELELRGAHNTARAMPVVQRIVGVVRKGGDRALRRYAAKLDGLTAQMPLQMSRTEMEQAWDATPKPLHRVWARSSPGFPPEAWQNRWPPTNSRYSSRWASDRRSGRTSPAQQKSQRTEK